MMIQDALYSLRKKAFDRLEAIGMPKETLPASAAAPSIDPSQIQPLPECADSYLVFVDGFFLPDLSRIPKGLISLPLDVALQTYGLFLQNRWTKALKEESDPFCALNAAMHGRGAFLYVPPHVQIEAPLQLLHILTGDALATPRLQITLGKQASLTLVQSLFSPGFCNNAIDLSLDVGSTCRFLDAQLLPADAHSYLSLRAALKRDARLEAFHITDGAKTVRCSASVELSEENSSAQIQSLAMLTDQRQARFHALVDHAAPHTTSRQHVKMALNGDSRSSFEGKIFVRSIADKTQAYQLNNNLLLSDTATAHAKPNLEIFASDVKASHGATFAQLSDEELFYLRSRGIPTSGARSLLTQGFCSELIEQVEIDSLKPLLAQAMTRVLA